MRVVIFGTGLYCENRINSIEDKVNIVAFIDNNPVLWGRKRKEIPIFAPNLIKNMQYDKIILMSLSFDEMKKQLLDMGILEEKIKSYEEVYAELNNGKLEIYFDKIKKNGGKKILIALHMMGYHCVANIALYTARVLQERGYQVTLIAANGDKRFIKSVTEKGFLVFIYGGIFCAEIEEMFWLQYFDYVIVNTYSMMRFALNVSKIKPSFWWLHESKDVYKRRLEISDTFTISELDMLNIYAVSNVARKNFNDCYPNIRIECLEYGIPEKNVSKITSKNKMIFAIIGYVSEIKGQDVLLDAIAKLSNYEKEKIEVWIIGKIGDDSYSQKIKSIAKNEESIKILGELNSDEMEEAYSRIDVVVCASRQDSFPTVIVEGMMYGRVCITTDVTGIASHIENGRNGFVCQSEDAGNLCSKIKWILSNKKSLKKIGENARKTYLEYFTMKDFGDRIEKIISSAFAF